jgi:hypothetical protein
LKKSGENKKDKTGSPELSLNLTDLAGRVTIYLKVKLKSTIKVERFRLSLHHRDVFPATKSLNYTGRQTTFNLVNTEASPETVGIVFNPSLSS